MGVAFSSLWERTAVQRTFIKSEEIKNEKAKMPGGGE